MTKKEAKKYLNDLFNSVTMNDDNQNNISFNLN